MLISSWALASEEKSPEDWAAELTKTYRSHQGYIARYHSERPDKSLDATIATHFSSGLGASDIEIKAGGEKVSMRSWITEDEIMYVDPPGPERYRVRGLADEIRFLTSFMELSSDYETATAPLAVSANPGMMLTADSFEAGLKVHSTVTPMWSEAVKGSEIAQIDEKEVTFETKLHGLVTIRKADGILTRQAFPDSPDGPRTLELVELELDPDANTILGISADWVTLGAEDVANGYLNFKHRLMLFQTIIDGIETGGFELKKLETKVDEDRLAFRKFADASISTRPGTKAAGLSDYMSEHLKAIRPVLKQHWLDSDPNAKADDIGAFEAYISSPETQEEVLDLLVGAVLKAAEKDAPDALREQTMPEFFGNNPKATLTSKSASGRMAKQLLEDTLTKAFFEAIISRQLSLVVREREGLD